MSLFFVSNDADDEMIEISPSIARTLVKAFRKQHSYWLYRYRKLRERTPSKMTVEQMRKISLTEGKVGFYGELVDSLTNQIDKCEYQKTKYD